MAARRPPGVARSRMEEVQHGGLGQHRLRNTVALRTAAVFDALGRLQIGTEMARTFDDAVALRKAFRFEAPQGSVDLSAVKRGRQSGRIVSRFGYSGRDMRTGDESRIADDGDAAECEP